MKYSFIIEEYGVVSKSVANFKLKYFQDYNCIIVLKDVKYSE